MIWLLSLNERICDYWKRLSVCWIQMKCSLSSEAWLLSVKELFLLKGMTSLCFSCLQWREAKDKLEMVCNSNPAYNFGTGMWTIHHQLVGVMQYNILGNHIPRKIPIHTLYNHFTAAAAAGFGMRTHSYEISRPHAKKALCLQKVMGAIQQTTCTSNYH